MMRTLTTLLIVALAATSVWLWHSLNQERERFARLQAEVEQSRQADAAKVVSIPVEPGPAEVLSQAAQPPGDPTPDGRAALQMKQERLLAKNPEYMEAMRKLQESMYVAQHADLLRLLGLPKGKTDELVALRVGLRLRGYGSLPPGADAASRRAFELEQQQRRFEADMETAALIGEDKLKILKEYDASMLERMQVKELRLALLDSSEPLAGDEAEALIRAFHEERQKAMREVEATMPMPPADDAVAGQVAFNRGRGVEIRTEWARRALERAEDMLSPAQFEVFRSMVMRQRRVESAQQEMLRARENALN